MEEGSRDGRTTWGAVLAAYAVLFAMGLADNARGPAYPRILQHFDIGASLGSLMFTAASVGSFLVSFTGRTWLARFGPRRAVRVSTALLAAACLGMGAVGFADLGVAGLAAVSLVFGVGATGSSMCANALVAQGSDPANRRRLLSGLHATYGASSLLSPLVVAGCGRLGLDWRAAFLFLAAAPLAAGALTVAAVPTAGGSPAREFAPTSHPSRAAAVRACAVLALYVAAEIAISTRLPLFAESHWRWSGDEAALCLSAFFALLLAGRLAFAVLRLPGSSARWMILSAAVSLVAYVAGLFLHPAGLAACGLTMSVFFPAAISWLREEFGAGFERVLASAVASVGVGLVSMHFAVGALNDLVGIRNALLVGPACLVAALALLLGGRRAEAARQQRQAA